MAQVLAVLACIIMLLLVLLSPVSTMRSTGLLVLSFADGRTLTLGPLGALIELASLLDALISIGVDCRCMLR